MKKNLLLAALCTFGTYATQAQVTQISSNKDLEFVSPIGTTKALFASETDHRLYVSDGTAAGTVLLSATITYDDNAFALNNKVIFKGTTTASGSELFVTDGTPGGTTLVKDISAGPTSSEIGDDVALLNGFVYFTAVAPGFGREIWKSDGTAAGTTLLKDIIAGSNGSNTSGDYNLFSNGTYLLFNAATPTSGPEVWISNGTEASTTLLKDINLGTPSSNANGFFKFGNITLFQATTATNGAELWKTDGTAAGTVMVKDINPGPVGSASMVGTFFVELNGKAIFDATDGVNGEELWTTDGTTAGTNLLKDIQTGPTGSFNLTINSMKVGNKIIFPSTNLFGSRNQLWETDGTPGGTNLFKDFTAGGEMPLIFATYDPTGTTNNQPLFQGNKFFFMAKTPAEGTELWVSNGTIAGTSLVKNINAGAADALENVAYQYTSDAVYFVANNGVNGTELWKSNGTDGGTVMVADINVGPNDSDPQLWPIFNGKLSFSANNGDNVASDLYVLNGNVTPLPIKLESFTVRLLGNDGLVQWVTSQEINTSHFIVQRSADGNQFENIGTVKASGNSSSQKSYSFTDVNAKNLSGAYANKSVVYYRLVAVDVDGKQETSRIISLPLQSKGLTANLLQNPVTSAANISISGVTNLTTLKLTDISGKVFTTSNQLQNGIQSIDMSHLSNGVYFITIESAGQKTNLKVVKQ